jgi:hypothetical protein
MLNFFKDLLLKEKVLFFSTLFVGIFLRLSSLSEISSWSDEVATWYFGHHLDQVFSTESHTPFYYFLVKLWSVVFSDSIFSIRMLSIFASYTILFLCLSLLKNGNKILSLGLVAFWSLSPTLIMQDRQARHYGLFAEMIFLLLIIWDYRSEIRFVKKWILMCAISLIHPLGLIPIWTLVFIDFFKRKLSLKESFKFLSSSIPVVGYYLLRASLFSVQSVLSNVSWVKNDFFTLFKSLILMFGGDSYPLSFNYPLNPDLFVFFVFLFFFTLFLFSKGFSLFMHSKFFRFFVLLLITFVFIEFLAILGVNLRIGRYYIFLVPFLFVYLLDSISYVQENKYLCLTALVLILSTYNFLILKPWRSFDWDDQFVTSFKKDYPNFLDGDFIFCGSRHQLEYYFQTQNTGCSSEAFSRFYAQKNFNVFDIRGEQSTLALSLYLSNRGNIFDRKFYGHSFFFKFERQK